MENEITRRIFLAGASRRRVDATRFEQSGSQKND